jgi:hypothetical protein
MEPDIDNNQQNPIVINTNGTPNILTFVSDKPTLDKGDMATFTTIATDPENDPLTYTYSIVAGNGNIINNTYVPSISNSGGTHTIKVVVSDGTNNTERNLNLTVNPSWYHILNDSYTEAWLMSHGITIYNNIPYITFRDNNNKISVMKYDNQEWVFVGPPSFSDGIMNCSCIAFNSLGELYAGYWDGTVSMKATIMKFNGISWNTIGTKGFTIGSANYFDFVFDNNNNIYAISQYNTIGPYGVLYKYDSSWQVLTNSFSENSIEFLDMEINNNDIYISFRDLNSISVVKYNGNLSFVGQRYFFTNNAYSCLKISLPNKT